MSLHMAQEHSAAYYSETRLTATVSLEDDYRSANAKDVLNVSHENKEKPTATKQALIAATRSKRFFCSRAYHERKYCPAINSTCCSCENIGHFSRVGRSNNGSGKRLKSTNQTATLSSASLRPMACPENLLRFAILVNLNSKNLTALLTAGVQKVILI